MLAGLEEAVFKMKIIVKGYFNLQEAMDGKSVLEVEKETATLRDLLDDLSKRFGKDLRELIFDPGTGGLVSHVMLLVNGRNYLFMPDRLDTVLKDGDEIGLFPPIAGG